MLAVERHGVRHLIAVLLCFFNSRGTLSRLSFFEAILLARHQETVSAMEVAFVDASLTDNLLGRVNFISLHVDDRRGNALALGGIILEFKCHLIAAFARSTSIYCIYFFVGHLIMLDII